MSAEEYLLQIKESDRHIGELVRLQSAMSGVPAPSERIARDRRLLEAQVAAAYEDNRVSRRRAQCLIDRLPDRGERQTLTLFYLKQMTADDAAHVLGMTPRQLYRVKKRALMHLDGLCL